MIRTTTTVIQGGAEVLRGQGGQADQGGEWAARQGARQAAGQAAEQAAGQGAGQGAAPQPEPRVTRRSRG